MIQYLLEAITFQLAFLLGYDLFLKRETFFQWNRVYLLGMFVFSMVLPWIKIEALKTTIDSETMVYPEFLGQLGKVALTENITDEGLFWEWFSTYEWIFLLGALTMAFSLLGKLYQIQNLRSKGEVRYYKGFTKITVKKSTVAFSFFKQVFLGDAIPSKRASQILAHELVHVRQWHSLDLLFFELMRIIMWFNPLVYLYQRRMVELHEFIADAEVAKEDKPAHYQMLLSEAFQTKSLSFVNQFFRKTLLKNRIVMLRKEKSNQVRLLKYLALLPLFLMMVVYTSCEMEEKKMENLESTELNVTAITEQVPFMLVQDVPVFPGCEGSADIKACFVEKIQTHIRKHFNYPKEAQDLGVEGRVAVMFTIDKNGEITNIQKRGPHALLENEVERIIQRLPQMQPGKHKGEVVEVPFSLPVNFKLE
ncbi:MAG: M56 family metallopeptidase [Bacteroidota bacterium]